MRGVGAWEIVGANEIVGLDDGGGEMGGFGVMVARPRSEIFPIIGVRIIPGTTISDFIGPQIVIIGGKPNFPP